MNIYVETVLKVLLCQMYSMTRFFFCFRWNYSGKKCRYLPFM